MKGGQRKASITYCHSERPHASIPKRRSDHRDATIDEREPQEIIKKNNDDHQKNKNDGTQNDHMEGSEDINFFYADSMTQARFLFI